MHFNPDMLDPNAAMKKVHQLLHQHEEEHPQTTEAPAIEANIDRPVPQR